MIKRNLLVIGLATLLSACGFQLRGTGTNELAIKELDLSARNAYGETVVDLRRALEASGVTVTSGAPYKLVLTNESNDQRATSYTGSSRSAEYELSSTLSYEVRDSGNLPLLNDKLEVQKSYVHDSNNLTGSDREEAQVRREMRRDMVQRMMTRLQGLTPAELSRLEQQAQARAKAEADAAAAAQRIRDATPQQSPMEMPAQ